MQDGSTFEILNLHIKIAYSILSELPLSGMKIIIMFVENKTKERQIRNKNGISKTGSPSSENNSQNEKYDPYVVPGEGGTKW